MFILFSMRINCTEKCCQHYINIDKNMMCGMEIYKKIINLIFRVMVNNYEGLRMLQEYDKI